MFPRADALLIPHGGFLIVHLRSLGYTQFPYQGLRNGGGIGNVLRSPSSKEWLFPARVIYDMLFFFVVIINVLNLIFGVIIDTFADLRSEKQQKEEIIKNSCFICGKVVIRLKSRVRISV